nr:type VI secretion system-associated FHA domain protein TagH [Pseudomonas thivervalensis]
MELVFEIRNTHQFVPSRRCQKTFGPAGGMIGRGEDCHWSIPDRERLMSKRHAQVSFRDGAFFLTDTSGNGTTHRESGVRLPKGEPVRIQDGNAYLMGDFELLARLVSTPAGGLAEASRPMPVDSLIPDDAFLELDPLKALDQRERASLDIDELINPTAMPSDGLGRPDYARIDMESLLLPELVEAPVEPAPAPVPSTGAVDHRLEDFWARFGTALGMDLRSLDGEAREALAINAALLLKQSIQGLQQSLRIRAGLKSELRQAQTYEEQVRLIASLQVDHHG